MMNNNNHKNNNNSTSNTLASLLESKSQKHSIIDVPIYTEEFLEHNKIREQELRNFRSFTTEYEERNAISSKHIENMREVTERLELEVEKANHSNQRLNQIYDCLKDNLVDQFGNELSDGIPAELVDNLINQDDDSGIQQSLQSQEFELGPVTSDNLDRFMDTLNCVGSKLDQQQPQQQQQQLPEQQQTFVTSMRTTISSLDEIVI